MFGCCEADQRKFKDGHGHVDQARLEMLTAEVQAADWDQARIEKVRECTCQCHNDGSQVFC